MLSVPPCGIVPSAPHIRAERLPIDSLPMEQRALGRSGLKVSRVGLGTMTWGADTDEHESADQLKAFLEAGGTLLDTSAGYSDGEAERTAARYSGVTPTAFISMMRSMSLSWS